MVGEYSELIFVAGNKLTEDELQFFQLVGTIAKRGVFEFSLLKNNTRIITFPAPPDSGNKEEMPFSLGVPCSLGVKRNWLVLHDDLHYQMTSEGKEALSLYEKGKYRTPNETTFDLWRKKALDNWFIASIALLVLALGTLFTTLNQGLELVRKFQERKQ